MLLIASWAGNVTQRSVAPPCFWNLCCNNDYELHSHTVNSLTHTESAWVKQTVCVYVLVHVCVCALVLLAPASMLVHWLVIKTLLCGSVFFFFFKPCWVSWFEIKSKLQRAWWCSLLTVLFDKCSICAESHRTSFQASGYGRLYHCSLHCQHFITLLLWYIVIMGWKAEVRQRG